MLGPLEVRGESGPIALSQGRPRRLLIALLLRVGRVVPSDVLIDDVWGERAPADPVNALQVQVSYLRRALELPPAGEAPALRTVGGGYVLDVPPQSIDLHRFGRLVASAAERLARQSPGEAEAALFELRSALELWRGEPLQDVLHEQFATAAVDRLGELHAAAKEHDIDARLQLGRHEEAVQLLRPLIVEHPLRERLRAQLVLALYRSGRQADALRAFGATRELLVEELGVEPGPELKRLQQQVLAHDPDLDWIPTDVPSAGPAGDPAVEGADVGHNVPWSPTPLIGRGPELAALAARLADPEVRLTTLVGPPGVGKTRLAVEVARAAVPDYPDGVWFAELGGLADPALVPTTVAAAAKVRTDGVASVTATVVSHFRHARGSWWWTTASICERPARSSCTRCLPAVPRFRSLRPAANRWRCAASRRCPSVRWRSPTTPTPHRSRNWSGCRRSPCWSPASGRSTPATDWTSTTPARWPSSAGGSTVSRSRSSWPPGGCAC